MILNDTTDSEPCVLNLDMSANKTSYSFISKPKLIEQIKTIMFMNLNFSLISSHYLVISAAPISLACELLF